MRRLPTLLSVACLAALASGCLPTHVPLPVVALDGAPASRTLVVFLPGRQSTASSYEEEGFVDAVRQAGLGADLVGVEAHLGYYRQGTLARRLHEDVIAPARARGYERIWLVGISLGGTGVLWYDAQHPGAVDGVVALSPFLGAPELGREIAAAGGLAGWSPGEVEPAADLRFLWKGLKAYQSPDRTAGRVYLAYGLGDDFAPLNELLARSLPPGQVLTAPGGHDWSTWRGLWDRLLREALAPRLAARRP